jgi:hypothetical protein
LKLYDLEAFTRHKQPDAGAPREEVVLNEVKFKVILDDNIIPPLEALEGKADRELILTRQRVVAQKKIEHPPILASIRETLAADGGNGEGDDASLAVTGEKPCVVEYDDQGVLPEGAYLFRDHVAFLHVDKRGRIKQIDLVKKRAKSSDDIGPPVNKEFTKMLIQDVKEHEWDELAALFLRHQ